MEILKDIAAFRQWRRRFEMTDPDQGRPSIGFVPTMGALHAGHMRLVEASQAATRNTVVSIFVNPLQFGPAEDLARYPRPFERDAALCEEAGVAALFAPDAGGFYHPDHRTYCQVDGLDRHLCGASRPGHFRGVCTVVLKLFHIVQPRRAYFGQKDIQQALILRKMVGDLSLDLKMEIVPTVREASGLALSSRNAYLSDEEKVRATALYRALRLAEAARLGGETDPEALRSAMRREIEASSPARIDYVEVVSQARLEPLPRLDQPAVLAVAAFYGTTRLIDNLLVP